MPHDPARFRVRPAIMSADRSKHTAHLLIFLTVLIDLIGFGILIPILQPFAQGQFGATQLQAAWLMGIYSLMQFVFSPVLGLWSDRIGRRPVIVASLVGSTLGYLIIVAAGTVAVGERAWLGIWLLFGARVVTGVCGASFSTAQAYLADITAPEKRAGVMGMIGAAFGLGFVLGPMIGGMASGTRLGPTLPFWIAAGLSALNALFCWLKLPESLPPEKRGEVRARRSILATVRALSHTAFPAVITANFLVIAAFSIMTTTFVMFTAKRFAFDEMANAKVFGFIGMIAILVQGGLIRRLVRNGNERVVALTGVVLMVVSLATLPWTTPWAWLLGNCALMALGNSLATPTLNAMASQCGTATTQGETMGAMSGAGSFGRFLGPFAAGWIFHFLPDRFDVAFSVSAGVMAVAGLAVAGIRRCRPESADSEAR